jgi:hypothetical protein
MQGETVIIAVATTLQKQNTANESCVVATPARLSTIWS